MAVRINLLPYRKIRRAERQKRFNFMLGGTLVAGIVVIFLGQNIIDGRIEHQQERNKRLETAIAKLDKEIAEIKELKEKIGDVLDRKRVVENLQSGRSSAVILLDELARQLPEGVYLRSVKEQGNVITLTGIADNNARVATLVRNFGNSQWLESPELVEIKATQVGNLKKSLFTLNLKTKSQQPASPNSKKK